MAKVVTWEVICLPPYLASQSPCYTMAQNTRAAVSSNQKIESKPIVACSHVFYRTLCHYFDWYMGLCVSFEIGLRDNFSFRSTTFIWIICIKAVHIDILPLKIEDFFVQLFLKERRISLRRIFAQKQKHFLRWQMISWMSLLLKTNDSQSYWVSWHRLFEQVAWCRIFKYYVIKLPKVW